MAHLVFGFPFLLGPPLLFLSLFPTLALHPSMGFLIIGIAVMLLPFLLPTSLLRFGGILSLLPSVVLQLPFFQFSILPVKQTTTFNSPYSKEKKKRKPAYSAYTSPALGSQSTHKFLIHQSFKYLTANTEILFISCQRNLLKLVPGVKGGQEASRNQQSVQLSREIKCKSAPGVERGAFIKALLHSQNRNWGFNKTLGPPRRQG